MDFEHQKKDFLEKKDRSKKGAIDKHIKKLVNMINKKENYYTTSSCSGRIVLLEKRSDKKQQSRWLYTTHEKAHLKDIKKALDSEHDVWFIQEPFILHICAKTIADAKKLLSSAQNIGVKRAGIISIGKKIILELIGTEKIHALMIKHGNILIDNDYIKILVKEANEKQKKNMKNIEKLTKEWK